MKTDRCDNSFDYLFELVSRFFFFIIVFSYSVLYLNLLSLEAMHAPSLACSLSHLYTVHNLFVVSQNVV